MKSILAILIFLLLLAGGGTWGYFYVFKPQEVVETPLHTEEISDANQLNLIQIRSFRVPILHSSVAVKILVFHVVLDMTNQEGVQIVDASMNHLVDLYIRYLVAYFEINSIDDRLNADEVIKLINQASFEVLGPKFPVRQVILQGVYQKSNIN